MTLKRREEPPRFWRGKPEELARKTAESVRGLMRGQGNNTFDVTLTAGTETEVLTEIAVAGQVAQFSAQSASAAAAAATVWAEVQTGKVVIHHDAGATDRRFAVSIHG